MKFQFNEEKAIAAILHISNNLKVRGKKIGLHKIFKILYFADREHLATWGRPITGDYFVAMKDGPVPSAIYDIFKSIRGDNFFVPKDTYIQYFDISSHWVTPKQEANLDVLSATDIEFINDSIEDNADLSFKELVGKSHGRAWETAIKNQKISYQRMAQEAGANSEMIAYIRTNAENSAIFA